MLNTWTEKNIRMRSPQKLELLFWRENPGYLSNIFGGNLNSVFSWANCCKTPLYVAHGKCDQVCIVRSNLGFLLLLDFFWRFLYYEKWFRYELFVWFVAWENTYWTRWVFLVCVTLLHHNRLGFTCCRGLEDSKYSFLLIVHELFL